jgi:hypothetical protein
MADDENLDPLGIACAVARIAGASVGVAVTTGTRITRFLAGMPVGEPARELEPQPSPQAPCPEPPGEEEAEAPGWPDVTDEDVREASFPSKAAKSRFQKALSGLDDDDVSVRADAAAKLGEIPGELSVRALTAHYLREPRGRVRQKCIHALTTLGMKEGLPAAERALGDRAAGVRLAAVRAVYQLAGADAASLLTRMRSDPNEGVRRRSRRLCELARRQESGGEAGAASD